MTIVVVEDIVTIEDTVAVAEEEEEDQVSKAMMVGK